MLNETGFSVASRPVFSVGLAPHPALSPRRCEQGRCKRRGEDQGEGACEFYATLGSISGKTDRHHFDARNALNDLDTANRIPQRDRVHPLLETKAHRLAV